MGFVKICSHGFFRKKICVKIFSYKACIPHGFLAIKRHWIIKLYASLCLGYAISATINSLKRVTKSRGMQEFYIDHIARSVWWFLYQYVINKSWTFLYTYSLFFSFSILWTELVRIIYAVLTILEEERKVLEEEGKDRLVS